MKRLMLLIPACALSIVLGTTSGHTQEGPEFKSREFMRRKLETSQKVLEGVVQEDYALVERNAVALGLLSQAAEWQVFRSDEYKRHSHEFRRSCDALAENARRKNMDGTALAYVQLTLNCVNCHKEVRKLKLDDPKRPIPTTPADPKRVR